jgi:hypothetical protein
MDLVLTPEHEQAEGFQRRGSDANVVRLSKRASAGEGKLASPKPRAQDLQNNKQNDYRPRLGLDWNLSHA